jgi:hypothetical protein
MADLAVLASPPPGRVPLLAAAGGRQYTVD